MPQAVPAPPHLVHFDPFDLDLRTGELWKDGTRILLQDHPFAILRRLIECPGDVVTRDELRARLWPNGTIVDFEHGLNTAMKRLREVLGDDAERPQFIETVRRRGYRFIAPVQAVSPPPTQGEPDLRPVSPGEPGARPGDSVPIGLYRLIEKVGSGTMGEVYLAEDRMLKRRVALKFLPPAFASDPGRLARLQREAEVLASLNHPNIAAIHGLGEAEGQRCLVLEFVEGETLAARITRRRMTATEALEVCGQIADALEAAHQKGIVHRDLNPGNVTISTQGRVKLLDFGLAKAFADHRPPGASPGLRTVSDSGIIVGTVRYMSPEQAAGKRVDQRTDIWSFGCVLFECLAGEPPFSGTSAPATLAAIVTGEPEWNRLPATLPPQLRSVIGRCLHKDPERRLHSIADVRIEMMDALAAPGEPAPDRWAARPGRVPPLVPAAVALLALGVVIGMLAARSCG